MVYNMMRTRHENGADATPTFGRRRPRLRRGGGGAQLYFPPLKIGDHCIRYVEQFKYLGHIVTDSLTDDEDINREIKNMFVLIYYSTNTSFALLK